MKLPTYLLLTTLVLYSQALDEEQTSDISSITKECEKESKVSPQLIDDLINHKIKDVSKYDDNEPLRKHMLCLHTKAGWLNKDGTYNNAALKKFVKEGVGSDEKADEVVKKCVSKGETLEDTAFKTFKCMYYNGA